jgi:hypothetical protein
MPTQIVMDSWGDTRHGFDIADQARAEERFRELRSRGYKAIALGEKGAPNQLIDKFDPHVEQTLFIPHLQGG